MQPPTLSIQNARWAYQDRLIFSKISFEIPSQKWIALLGPSGVGKTTLLKMIAGLMNTKDSFVSADNDLEPHEQIAYMAQTDLLLPWTTVLDNALLSIRLRHHTTSTRHDKIQLAKELLHRVNLGNNLNDYPHELSGGMRQRVALVRTLLTEKPIILMDEPFSSLDAISRYQLQETAAQIFADRTVFFITHDPLEALRLANIIYIMKGHPATLKAVATLNAPIPRSVNHSEIIALQSALYQELSLAVDETNALLI